MTTPPPPPPNLPPTYPYSPNYPAPYPIFGNPLRDLAGHVRTLGILFCVYGGLALLSIGFASLWFGYFLLHPGSDAAPTTVTAAAHILSIQTSLHPNLLLAQFPPGFDLHTIPFLSGILTFALVICLLSIVLPIVAGYALLKRKPWGRTLALVNAWLIVLSFPFGTALGIYTLIVFLKGGARDLYAQLAAQALTPANLPYR